MRERPLFDYLPLQRQPEPFYTVKPTTIIYHLILTPLTRKKAQISCRQGRLHRMDNVIIRAQKCRVHGPPARGVGEIPCPSRSPFTGARRTEKHTRKSFPILKRQGHTHTYPRVRTYARKQASKPAGFRAYNCQTTVSTVPTSSHSSRRSNGCIPHEHVLQARLFPCI